MVLNINGQMMDADDPQITYRLDTPARDSACLIAMVGLCMHREALVNSPSGRARLAEYPQRAQALLIPGIWGEAATVEDVVPDAPPMPPIDPQPDPTERIAELEQQVADLTAAIERGISL